MKDVSRAELARSHEAQRVRGLLPLWLVLEAEYANDKYRGRNPQFESFGQLEPGSAAYQDFAQYFRRFAIFYNQSQGETQLLLKASQQLGKFVGCGRELVGAVLTKTAGYDRPMADAVTAARLKERLDGQAVCSPVFGFEPAALDGDETWSVQWEPMIARVKAAIDAGVPEEMMSAAEELFDAQVQLFLDFSLDAGVLAAPGFTSGDVYPWEAYAGAES